MTASGKRALLVSNSGWGLSNFHLPIARALRDSGWDVGLVCPPGAAIERLEADGFRVIPWRLDRGSMNPLREAAALLDLIRIYRRERPELVHHFTIKPNLYGTLAARLVRVPAAVNSWEGLGHVFRETTLLARGVRLALSLPMRFALATRRSWTICLNDEDATELVRRRMADPDRLSVLPGVGVDTDRFRPASNGHDGTVVMMVSRLLRDKGVYEYASAARTLRRSGDGSRFLLVGTLDPDNPAALTPTELAMLESERDVELLGHREDMPGLFQSADVVVLPSYHEGASRVLQEAAATGLPLVATDIAGCRTAVQHGRNGLLVPVGDTTALADAIGRLASDAELRQGYGSRSREIAEAEFSEAAVVDQYLHVYDQATRAR